MTRRDIDKLLAEARQKVADAVGKHTAPAAEWSQGMADAFETLREAYAIARSELDPDPTSAVWWAFWDAEVAARDNAELHRREASQ
jgi:hypothetical protein